MFCQKCGQDIEDNASACSGCSASSESGKGIGWGILSFLVPIVGLILYFVFKKDKPKASKACLIGTLTGFVISIISLLLLLLSAVMIAPNVSRANSLGDLIGCKSNLKNLGTACELWSRNNKGRYHDSLSQLTPNYLETIPVCPSAGKDTYSSSYSSTEYRGDVYVVYCEGSNHRAAGIKDNYPLFSSVQGLVENE